MTTLITRARLLSTVLRTGDKRRIRRIIDRFEVAELTKVLSALDHLDLRRVAAALCAEDGAEESVLRLDAQSLARLALAATSSVQTRLLMLLSRSDSATCASVLMAMPEAERLDAIARMTQSLSGERTRRLPGRARPQRTDEDLGAALRLQRLFA